MENMVRFPGVTQTSGTYKEMTSFSGSVWWEDPEPRPWWFLSQPEARRGDLASKGVGVGAW